MTIQDSYGISIRKNDAFAHNWKYVWKSYIIRVASAANLKETLKYTKR